MKKSTLKYTLLICLAPSLVLAQSTVDFSAGIGERDVLDVNNQPLASGNVVSVGFFDAGFDVTSYINDLAALDAAWNEFSSTSIRTVFDENGRFSDSYSSFDPVFDDQQICMIIYQTSDNGAPDASFSNVTGYGIYTSSLSNWTFPSQGSIYPFNTTYINSTEVNEAMFGTFDANHLMLMPIPEPSTLALGFLALGSLLLLRHRRRA